MTTGTRWLLAAAVVCAALLAHASGSCFATAGQEAEAHPQRRAADSTYLVQKVITSFRETLPEVQPLKRSGGPILSATEMEQPSAREPAASCVDSTNFWGALRSTGPLRIEQPVASKLHGRDVEALQLATVEQSVDWMPNETAVETSWGRMCTSLLSLEIGQHPREPSSRKFGLAVTLIGFSALVCTGVCCVKTGLYDHLAAKVLVESDVYSKDESANPFFPTDSASAFMQDRPMPARLVSKLSSITFSGSARGIAELATGTASELLLEPANGVTLCIVLECAPGGRSVKVERIYQEHRTPMAVCHCKDGEFAWEVCDTARTFTGHIKPLPTARKDVIYLGLVRGSLENTCPILIVEGSVHGRPTSGQALLSAISASGKDVGSLTVNEETVEVTIIHSPMDSMVLLFLIAFYLFRSDIRVKTKTADEGSDAEDAVDIPW